MNEQTSIGPAAALLRLGKERDPQAWEAVVLACGESLRRCCARILGPSAAVDDAIQDAFLHVRDDAAQFRPPPDGDIDRAALAWIRAVACNTAMQHLRREQRLRHRHDRHHMRNPSLPISPAAVDVAQDKERDGLMRSALADLPAAMRLAVVLHHQDGQSFAEIGLILRCREGSARSLAHRGLRRLRERLGRAGLALAVPACASVLAGMEAPAVGFALDDDNIALLEASLRAETTGVPAAPLPPLAIGVISMSTISVISLGVMAVICYSPQPMAAERIPYVTPATTASEAGGRGLFASVPPRSMDDDHGETLGPFVQDGERFLPAFARLRPGDVLVTNEIGEAGFAINGRLLRRAGLLHCCGWDANGVTIFDGPVESTPQRRLLPEGLARLFFDADGRLDPTVVTDAYRQREELDASLELRLTVRAGILHALVRQGSEARIIFDGWVATPEQRAALPDLIKPMLTPEIWRQADAGFTANALIFWGRAALPEEPAQPFAAQ